MHKALHITKLMTDSDLKIISILSNTNNSGFHQAYINVNYTFCAFTHHNVVFPQTRAIALFQPNTAKGKLNADITPTTPRGFHISSSA